MVINVSVVVDSHIQRIVLATEELQNNGGLLPDIIMLTLCDSIGEPF